jgi:membrane-bound ClpP family serine protease
MHILILIFNPALVFTDPYHRPQTMQIAGKTAQVIFILKDAIGPATASFVQSGIETAQEA